MGNFYTNLTLRGPQPDAALAAVRALGYHAYVSPTNAGLTVICEERSTRRTRRSGTRWRSWDDIETPAPPRGGDARALCESLGMPGNLPEVERILRAYDEPAAGDEFLFASDRHAALVKALNWPKIPYLQGFGYLTRKSPPDGWRVVP